MQKKNNNISYDRLFELALADENICNAVIEKYLGELESASHVPTVRGYSALSIIPKPKTLEDAKKIVDGCP